MNHSHPERVRQQLRGVLHDVEDVLQQMTETGGERVDAMRASAGAHLHDAARQLGALERRGARHVLRAGREVQRYARRHPWQIAAAGVATVALTLTVLARRRH